MPTRPSARRVSRLILALAVIVNAVIALPAFAADKVAMGWLPATDALPFFVALEEKSFEKVGIEVVNQRFTSPTALVDALISNQIDVGPYGTAPGIALVAEAQNPGSLKLFGLSGGIADTEYVNSTLLVKKGSPIHDFADLKGKKIGHMPGIQWRTNTKYILRNAGVDPDKDVVLTELALNVQIPAVVSGAVDALIAIEPMGSMAIAAGDVQPIVVNVGAKVRYKSVVRRRRRHNDEIHERATGGRPQSVAGAARGHRQDPGELRPIPSLAGQICRRAGSLAPGREEARVS